MKQARSTAVKLKKTLSNNAAVLATTGHHTRALGDALTGMALLWVWRWGWSSPSLIDYITLDSGRRGKAARLVARGLLKRTDYGHGLPDTPRQILTLTDLGVQELCRLQSEINPELAEVKIRWNQIRHDYLVQCLVAEKYAQHLGKLDYRSGPELALRFQSGKIPDAVIGRAAIELELTPKKPSEMSMAVIGLADLYQTGVIKGVLIFSPIAAVLTSYEKYLAPGRKLQSWRRDPEKRVQLKGDEVRLTKIPPIEFWRIQNSTPNFLHRNSFDTELIQRSLVRSQGAEEFAPLSEQEKHESYMARMAEEERREREAFEANLGAS